MKTQTKIKYLEKARDLIGDKEKWCQGADALDADGDYCNPKDQKAASFCALGAIEKVCRRNMNVCSLLDIVEDEARKSTGMNIIKLNDKSGPHAHRRVIGVFNRAIQKLHRQL